jgi:hypothetical protein
VSGLALADLSVGGATWRSQAFKVWLALSAFLLLISAGGIIAREYPDPDDALRLAQVRDLIAGQGWFDLHQYRVDPAHGGVLMHWSRLVDVPLAVLIVMLAPLVGQPLAEMFAMVAVPLLIFGGVLALVYRLAYQWLDERAALYSCLALALSVPVLQQLIPLRIDHHGWQILAAMVAVSALFLKSARTGGLIAGAALAVGLSISLEGLPFAAVFVAVTALRWLRDRAERGWTVYTMLSLGGLSPLLFLATRGIGDLALHCDVITLVHLGVLAWGTVSVGALAALNPQRPLALGAGFALIGGVAVAGALSAAPQCLGGAFGQLDPLTRALWYQGVHEGLPIWRQSVTDIASTAVGVLIGLQAAVRLALAAPTPDQRRQWTEYSILLGAAVAIAFLVVRAGGLAAVLAAMPLGWQLRRWIPATLGHASAHRKIAGFVILLLTLVPSGPVSIARAALPVVPGTQGDIERIATFGQECKQSDLPDSLARLGAARMLAPLDLGPELIADTRLTVIATGHHRGNAAMHNVIATFLGSTEAAHGKVRAMQADYVMLCPTQAEIINYRVLRPNGFAADLAEGRAPAWLAPVRLPEADTSFRVWRVVR